MKINNIKSIKSFDGLTNYYEHNSKVTKTSMNFSTFVPGRRPVKNAIIWLSGLTCTEENFITKSGVQNLLKDTDTMVICPDTSPRGLNLPGEHDSYDFGSGAGFYVNATTKGYKDHYKMYDYISKEIIEILKSEFNITSVSIMGHSMGGHGALVLALNEPELFKSVSAFSPIVNPINCPWGQKAFKGYFGSDTEALSLLNDATEIIKSGKVRSDTILIEQGLSDDFLGDELLTDNFIQAAKAGKQKVKVNYRDGYDHSYFFIASFLGNHIEFHLSKF